MGHARLLAGALLLCCALAEEDPFAGNWKANIAKSKLDPNHLLESATLRFEFVGDVIRLTSAGVTKSGKAVSQTTELKPDGQEHADTGAPAGYVIVTRRVNPRKLEMVSKKDGQVLGGGTFEVSADGKTLTSKTSGTDAAGRPFEQMIVFERETAANR